MFNLIKNLMGQRGNNELLAQTVNSIDAYLVDVRTPHEFAKGSAKGAVNIPLDKVQTQLAKFKGKEQIVVFCRSGNRSRQAKYILEQNGFENITNGGTWQKINALTK